VLANCVVIFLLIFHLISNNVTSRKRETEAATYIVLTPG